MYTDDFPNSTVITFSNNTHTHTWKGLNEVIGIFYAPLQCCSAKQISGVNKLLYKNAHDAGLWLVQPEASSLSQQTVFNALLTVYFILAHIQLTIIIFKTENEVMPQTDSPPNLLVAI